MINFLTYEDVSWVFYLLGFLHEKKHMKYRHICSTWSVARFDPRHNTFWHRPFYKCLIYDEALVRCDCMLGCFFPRIGYGAACTCHILYEYMFLCWPVLLRYGWIKPGVSCRFTKSLECMFHLFFHNASLNLFPLYILITQLWR